MTIAVASGFALLALMSGFAILKDYSGLGSYKPTGDYVGTVQTSGGILDLSRVPLGRLPNDGVCDYPFSYSFPDYTGAFYMGNDWYLMANGYYFNRTTKEWAEAYVPTDYVDSGSSGSSGDDGKGSGSGAVAGGVAGGIAGSVIGSVVDTGTEVVTTVVSTRSKIYLAIIGAITTIAVYNGTKGNR